MTTGNLSEQVYSRIRNALMEGRYEPGDRLRISSLASDLGVSITPVREAIFRLVSDRALEMKVATAIHVPMLTAEQLREIQLVRILLEGEAAAIAATKITKTQLSELRALQARLQKAAAVDSEKAANLNRQFHFSILAIADMPLIYATVENMWVLMGPLLRTFHIRTPLEDLTGTDHRHFGVLKGLSSKEPERARQAMQEDIRWSKYTIEWTEGREQALVGTEASK